MTVFNGCNTDHTDCNTATRYLAVCAWRDQYLSTSPRNNAKIQAQSCNVCNQKSKPSRHFGIKPLLCDIADFQNYSRIHQAVEMNIWTSLDVYCSILTAMVSHPLKALQLSIASAIAGIKPPTWEVAALTFDSAQHQSLPTGRMTPQTRTHKVLWRWCMLLANRVNDATVNCVFAVHTVTTKIDENMNSN